MRTTKQGVKYIRKAWTIESLLNQKTESVIHFPKAHDLSNWKLYSDNDLGGYTTASFVQTFDRNVLFKGNLSLKRRGTKMMQSGYASIMTQSYIDLHEYDAFLLKIRTDGRMYIMNVKANNSIPDHMYQAIFTTEKNDMVDLVIPFSKFVATRQGMVVPSDGHLEEPLVYGYGFLMAERKEGPFEMEIESITAVTVNDNTSKRYTGMWNADEDDL
eukprot:TRINITY_DN12792_c0_g2_i1.p1 TRINITY_DN12792_c0_g2~~TRINITY_DN12792_c0_g2_i1.p1  ORF type:complete len:215 (+),score=20.00 TRINITY_DN12792_c0_g2_i1:80-724(+)